ncbi:hypothetical protein ACTAZI_12215 [Legionella bozemanae]|uniref:hypothetical protein n=1 Tax=Legionella bozemanae TaxID=447 RepID=UPI003EEBE698
MERRSIKATLAPLAKQHQKDLKQQLHQSKKENQEVQTEEDAVQQIWDKTRTPNGKS